MSRCLDFTSVSQIQQKYAKRLDDIAGEIRGPYVNLVSQISESYGSSLDWWVTPVACRNTYACNLFLHLCQLALTLQVVNEEGIDKVIVDSPALAQVLRKILPTSVKIHSSVSINRWRCRFMVSMMRCLVGTLYKFSARILAAKFTAYFSRHSCKPPNHSVVIIDTIVYSHSIQGMVFKDRHYPGLLSGLDACKKDNVYWAPYYYGVRNYYGLFKKLRSCKDNFFLAEDYLKFSDYVFAISHFMRCAIPQQVDKFQGVGVKSLVRETYLEHLASSSSIEALLRFRFAKRLSEAGVQIHRVIEWFENQEIDHGSVFGWRTFFPAASIIGYQGFFASRNYLCMFPMSLEKKLGLLPHIVAVIGRDYVLPAKEFCTDLRVILAPSFRFHSMWSNHTRNPEQSYYTILVSLPIVKADYMAILSAIEAALPSIEKTIPLPLRFLVKPHPATKMVNVNKFLLRFSSVRLELCNVNLEQAFSETDVVISSASSTCMEAVIRNIPVAIIARPGRLTQNPILQTVDERLWSICYTSKELSDVLYAYSKLVRDGEKKLERAKYDWHSILTVEPTNESISNFLDMPSMSSTSSNDAIGVVTPL